jgi:hypothetical protein
MLPIDLDASPFELAQLFHEILAPIHFRTSHLPRILLWSLYGVGSATLAMHPSRSCPDFAQDALLFFFALSIALSHQRLKQVGIVLCSWGTERRHGTHAKQSASTPL